MTEITQSDILMPCPFCGGAPAVLEDPAHSSAFEVECTGLTPCAVQPSTWGPTRSEAIEAWNRRVEPVAWTVYDWEYADPSTGEMHYARTPEKAAKLRLAGVKITPVYRPADLPSPASTAVKQGEPVAWQWSDFSGKWYTVDTARIGIAEAEQIARACAKDHGGRVRAAYASPSLSGISEEMVERAVEAVSAVMDTPEFDAADPDGLDRVELLVRAALKAGFFP